MFCDFYHYFSTTVKKKTKYVWHCFCLFSSRSGDGHTLSPVTCIEWDTAQREQTIWGICQDLTDSKQRRVRMAGSRERGNREPSTPIAACRLRCVLRSERLRDVCLRARESPGGCETQSTSITQTETEPRREKQAAQKEKKENDERYTYVHVTKHIWMHAHLYMKAGTSERPQIWFKAFMLLCSVYVTSCIIHHRFH